jgi:type II secretory pathway pseudopilin PulG
MSRYRGQAALEYIMIIAFAALLLVPFVYYSFVSSQENTRVLQATQAVNEIAKAADYVWSQGYGSRTTVRVFIPLGVNYSGSYIGRPSGSGPTVESKEINLNVLTSAGTSDIFAPTKGPVKGFWPTNTGTYLLTIYMSPDGYVLILPYGMDFDVYPTYFSFSLPAGGSANFSFNVTSYSTEENIDLNLSTAGDIASWIGISTYGFTLTPLSSNAVSGTVTVPAQATPGLLSGKVLVFSNFTTREVLIDIVVYLNETPNATKPNYTVQTYNDSSYLYPWDIFYQGNPASIDSGGWGGSTNVTLAIAGPAGTVLNTTITTDGAGAFEYSWDPVGNVQGQYTVYVNDSTITKTTTFQVLPCS